MSRTRTSVARKRLSVDERQDEDHDEHEQREREPGAAEAAWSLRARKLLGVRDTGAG